MSNSESDEEKAEQLLQESKEKRRHTSDPAENVSPAANGPDLKDAIKDVLAEIDAGERHENVTFRDGKYAALFGGLDAAGEIEDLSLAALDHLDQDSANVDGDLDARATAIRLLVKVAITEVQPDLMDTFEEAGREYQREQADDFSL